MSGDSDAEDTLNQSFIELTLNPYTEQKQRFLKIDDYLGRQIKKDFPMAIKEDI